MEKIWMYYYLSLAAILAAGFGYYAYIGIHKHASLAEHPIAVNLTKENGTCRLTWLGGWDFDSFYTNVTVNGVNIGHPWPMSVIYEGVCKDIVVKMFDRSVRSDILLYRYNHTRAT